MSEDGNELGHIRKLYMEAIFPYDETTGQYGYAYVGYDNKRRKDFQRDKLSKYNIQAWATIPTTKNGVMHMRLFAGKDNNILEFTMQHSETVCHRNILCMLNIRSDYGHGTQDPHIDVELLDPEERSISLDDKSNKILDKKVPQPTNFLNYEAAINAVFMQVEKYNPLIGAQYWLSPFEVFPHRVGVVEELRKKSGISTSLSILSRMVNIQLYETKANTIVDDDLFRQIVCSQIQVCKEEEAKVGGEVDITHVGYSTNISKLPFLFFIPTKPSGANYLFKLHNPDGMQVSVMPDGVVYDQKDGKSIVRDLSEDEK